jgi:hypothetical protein
VFDDILWKDGGKNTTQKAVQYLQQPCTIIDKVTDELGNCFLLFQKK